MVFHSIISQLRNFLLFNPLVKKLASEIIGLDDINHSEFNKLLKLFDELTDMTEEWSLPKNPEEIVRRLQEAHFWDECW